MSLLIASGRPQPLEWWGTVGVPLHSAKLHLPPRYIDRNKPCGCMRNIIAMHATSDWAQCSLRMTCSSVCTCRSRRQCVPQIVRHWKIPFHRHPGKPASLSLCKSATCLLAPFCFVRSSKLFFSVPHCIWWRQKGGWPSLLLRGKRQTRCTSE